MQHQTIGRKRDLRIDHLVEEVLGAGRVDRDARLAGGLGGESGPLLGDRQDEVRRELIAADEALERLR